MTEHPFLIVDKATFYGFVSSAPEDVRCEFVRGRIIQEMNGGTLRHANIAKRIGRLIENQLSDHQWVVLNGSVPFQCSRTR